MKTISRITKTIGLLSGLLFSLNATATTPAGSGQEWIGPFTIKKVARYWDGAHRTTVHVNEKINTGCPSSDNDKKVSYYYANEYGMNTALNGPLMAAQAQNKKVMLLIDQGCHPTYGKNLHGVEILTK